MLRPVLVFAVCGWWILSSDVPLLAQSGPVNLALNKPAQQSSTSQWSRPNDAQGAVDGIKNGGYAFHTNHEPNPWWQVDLQTMSTVSELRIYNRMDLPERARTLQVLLSNDGVTWRRVYAHNGQPFGGADGKPLIVNLNGAQTRFVRLQLSETIWFHLDEVEVFGVVGVSGPAPGDHQPPGGTLGAAACRGFTGTWTTQHGPVTLTVEGQTVTGSYPHNQGRIEGRLAGSVLEGRWIQTDRPGLLRFELAPDGKTFRGSWTEANGTGGGGWDGTCAGVPASAATTAPPAPAQVATWATTAADHRSQTGQRFTYACPSDGTPARVWGTDIYTDDSSVCTAAVHAGLITPAAGGTVTIEIRPGQTSYMGTGRYGIMTESYGGWTGSYVVIGLP